MTSSPPGRSSIELGRGVPIYYLAWVRDEVAGDDEIGWVERRYLDHLVAFNDENERWAIAAIGCFVSQFSPAEMAESAREQIADPSSRIYLRRLLVRPDGHGPPRAFEGLEAGGDLRPLRAGGAIDPRPATMVDA